MSKNSEKFVLKAIASKVRTWAEEHVKALNQSKRYHDFSENDLSCMCAYASTVLLSYLHWLGVHNAVLIANEYHCFVMVDDYVVDVTATQFCGNFKKVEVCRLKTIREKSKYGNYWATDFKFESVEKAFSYLDPRKSTGFPKSQYFTTKAQMKLVVTKAILQMGVV